MEPDVSYRASQGALGEPGTTCGRCRDGPDVDRRPTFLSSAAGSCGRTARHFSGRLKRCALHSGDLAIAVAGELLGRWSVAGPRHQSPATPAEYRDPTKRSAR